MQCSPFVEAYWKRRQWTLWDLAGPEVRRIPETASKKALERGWRSPRASRGTFPRWGATHLKNNTGEGFSNHASLGAVACSSPDRDDAQLDVQVLRFIGKRAEQSRREVWSRARSSDGAHGNPLEPVAHGPRGQPGKHRAAQKDSRSSLYLPGGKGEGSTAAMCTSEFRKGPTWISFRAKLSIASRGCRTWFQIPVVGGHYGNNECLG